MFSDTCRMTRRGRWSRDEAAVRSGVPPVAARVDDIPPPTSCGRQATVGLLLVAAIVLGCRAAPNGWHRVAARWKSDAALTRSLETCDQDEVAAAAQTLYDRLRAGQLAGDALTAAARAMWSARVGIDARLVAGEETAISLSLDVPKVLDDDFADGRPGPEISWRLAEVTLDDGRPLTLSNVVAPCTPLTKYAPTVWCAAALPSSTPAGLATMRYAVDFAVRARPGGPVVGHWTQRGSQYVELVETPAALASDQ